MTVGVTVQTILCVIQTDGPVVEYRRDGGRQFCRVYDKYMSVVAPFIGAVKDLAAECFCTDRERAMSIPQDCPDRGNNNMEFADRHCFKIEAALIPCDRARINLVVTSLL